MKKPPTQTEQDQHHVNSRTYILRLWCADQPQTTGWYASPGQVNDGGGEDKVRIKIWDASGVVYDNMIGYPEDMDSANPQAIGGGCFVIHNK